MLSGHFRVDRSSLPEDVNDRLASGERTGVEIQVHRPQRQSRHSPTACTGGSAGLHLMDGEQRMA